MTLHHSISDFIELYLSIDLPKKEIELIKARSLMPLKNDDTLEQVVISYRKAVHSAQKHFLKFRAKSHYSLPDQLESLLHLPPDDFLLVVGSVRYGLNQDALSLILKVPVESIVFRSEHLKNNLRLNEDEIKNIHHKLKPLEKRRYSQFQKIKNKFRPQRFLWESAIIMFSIMIVLWSIPELRNRYEKWVQLKTSEYFVSSVLKDAPVPTELNSNPSVIEPEISAPTDEPTEVSKTERKQPIVSEGEVWRFSFTGSAKLDLEKELKRILLKYSTQAPRSSIAPGGIQYDAFVKVSDLVALKIEFEALTDSQSQTLKMSWYKKKMMNKKIPSGHVEVISWISTI